MPNSKTFADEFKRMVCDQGTQFLALTPRSTNINGFWIIDKENTCLPMTQIELCQRLKVRIILRAYIIICRMISSNFLGCLQGNTSPEELKVNSDDEAADLIENVLKNMGSSDSSSIYGTNTILCPAPIPPVLINEEPESRHPETNGVIIPRGAVDFHSYYLAGSHSFTELQINDCNRPDGVCHFMRWGDNDNHSWRGWLCISPDDTKRASEAICSAVRKLTIDKYWANQCADGPHYHKNILVSPTFLRERGIKFKVIIQRSSDLVHVDKSVYYQVMSFGLTLVEEARISKKTTRTSSVSKRHQRHCRLKPAT